MGTSIKSDILQSIEPLVSDLQYVSLAFPSEKVNALLELISSAEKNNWQSDYIFFDGGEKTLNYLSIFAALSFCYWGEPKWHIILENGDELGGSYGLFYCLKKAILEGKDITDVNFIEKLTLEEFTHMLKGANGTELPFLHVRFLILKEIGKVLADKFNGSFLNLFEKANYDVNKINSLLVENFDCFKDSHDFSAKKVKFYRKSQEVISLNYEIFEGENFGAFKNIDDLTVSSDYKLPQILNYLGFLEYSPELEKKIASNHLFQMKDRESLEIRAATIKIGEELVQLLCQKGQNINSLALSNILWTETQNPSFKVKALPYPRMKSIWV